jgi:NADH:ubiquinone oxidoreductase subunit 6 (subunit J)
MARRFSGNFKIPFFSFSCHVARLPLAMTFEILPLLLIAAFTLGVSGLAFFLRNIIHCALLLTVGWTGIGAFYLWAGAEFVAFAQVLVYVGAVSMVVLFAVLLTRRAETVALRPARADIRRFAAGGLVAAAVAAVLVGAIVLSPLPGAGAPAGVAGPALSVKEIGLSLMGEHTGALLILGVLLTVALLGAVVLAAPDEPDKQP